MYVPSGPSDALANQICYWQSVKWDAGEKAKQCQLLILEATRAKNYGRAEAMLKDLQSLVDRYQGAKIEIEKREALLAPPPPPPEPRDEIHEKKILDAHERIRRICAPAAPAPTEKINAGPILRAIAGASQHAIASQMFIAQHGEGTARALGLILPTPKL
jgi:hypothetical protein